MAAATLPDPPDPEALAWLALSRTADLGPVRAAALVAVAGSATAAVEAAHRPPPRLPGLSPARARAALARIDLEAAEREAWRGARVGARLVACGRPGYPTTWRPADGWPPVLWVRGVWPEAVQAEVPRALAVVGPRRASPSACAFAGEVAERAAWAGAWVVSGLAFGIDAAAHAAAVGAATSGAPASTISVLASGVDRPTPTAHRALARAILDAGGALVAAAAIGAAPPTGAFPVRNRWIAGLAGAVAIVEAGVRSGALHTAAAALDLGREVRVAPARPWDAHAAGSLALLRDGAAPVIVVTREGRTAPDGAVALAME
ncbi:MAG: DNA-processing protein DprA, partial [Trueperaceae bacterium]|nr:DNA-processing protein DprA [Trueperaceae bacterium]